ncbi:MAG: hypothetical protein PUB22_02730 [Clostridiales bacterium]|nr:hypothetical protein [Clostridiales bacterium]
MGIVIFRSMGERPLPEEEMDRINLAENEEVRRIVCRAVNHHTMDADLRSYPMDQAAGSYPMEQASCRHPEESLSSHRMKEEAARLKEKKSGSDGEAWD